MAAIDSVLRTFFIEVAYPEELSSLRLLLVSLSEDKIAIIASNKLIVTQGFLGKRSSLDWETPSQTIVEFDEEYGRASALKWLSSDVICVGFEYGCVACFLSDGTCIFEFHGHSSQVQALRVSNKELYPGLGVGLWVLFEEGIMLTIPLKNIFNNSEDGVGKFRFTENCQLNDFVFLPNNLFKGSKNFSDISHCMLLSGFNPVLSMHHFGGKVQQQAFSKLAAMSREKSGTAISKTLSSFFGGNASPGLPGDKAKAQDSLEEINMTAAFDFEDTKRRVIRMSIDPRGKLIACADSLGRVTLFDTRLNAVVRIWKGVRDARLAWCEGSATANGTTHNTFGGTCLSLAIYAPQIGLLSLYAMKHGGCLRTIPVGPQAQIMTIFEKNANGERLAKCGLIRLQPKAATNLYPADGAMDGGPADDQAFESETNAKLESLTLTIISPFNISETAFDTTVADDFGFNSNTASIDDMQNKILASLPSSPSAVCSSGLLRDIENILIKLIQNEIDRRTPNNVFISAAVDPDVEEEIVRLASELKELTELQLCIDFVDSVERFGVLQYPFGRQSQSHNGGLHPILKSFCSKLDILRSKCNVTTKTPTVSESHVVSFDNVSIASSPNPDSVLMAKAGSSSSNQAQLSLRKSFSTIEFSIRFHKMLAKLLFEIGESSARSALRRLAMLDCFELLRQQCVPSTLQLQTSVIGIDPNTLNRSEGDLMDSIQIECRKNTIKAEALCWAMRIRRASNQRSNSGDMLGTPDLVGVKSPSTNGSVASPTPVASLASKKGHKQVVSQIVSQLSPPILKSSFNNSSSSYSPTTSSAMTRKSMSTLSDASISLSTPSNTSDMWDSAPEDYPLSFAVFCAFLDDDMYARGQLLSILLDASTTGDSDAQKKSYPEVATLLKGGYRLCTLHYMSDDFLSLIGDNEYRLSRWKQANESAVDFQNSRLDLPSGPLFGPTLNNNAASPMDPTLLMFPIDSLQSSPLRSIAAGLGNVLISSSVLSLIWSPALVESFNLQLFTSVLCTLGLHGGWRLNHSLPLLLSYFERLPFMKLATFMTTSSPIQRWLRDCLLAFENDLQPAIDTYDERLIEKGLSTFQSSCQLPNLANDEEKEEYDQYLCEQLTAVESVRWLKSCASYYRASGQGECFELSNIDFDLAVKFALRAVYTHVEQSQNLEAAMIFATVVLETIQLVGDQLERRSYGKVHLKQTIQDWSFLRKQLRTTMFLSCRCGFRQLHLRQQCNSTPSSSSRPMSTPLVTMPLTVHALNTGIISVFALLAADTLCFASRADHAIEHENRCLQVYSRRVTEGTAPVPSSSSIYRRADNQQSDTASATSSASSSSSKAILAWGAGADRRWRELIQVTESEDQVEEDSSLSSMGRLSVSSAAEKKRADVDSSSSKKIRRRRPLLLFFPHHNDSNKLGVYRIITLLQKWLRKPAKMELLMLCVDHLINLSEDYAPAIAFYILRKSLLPILKLLFLLENNPSERPPVSSQQRECINALVTPSNLQQFIKLVIDLISRTANPSSFFSRSVADTDKQADEDVWPPTQDTFIEYLTASYVSKRVTANLPNYLAVLWVLYLRSTCGLRGIKPCELFYKSELNSDLLDQISGDIICKMLEGPTGPKSSAEKSSLLEIRYEFILQCFRRVEVVDCDQIVYRLAGIDGWRMDPNHIKLAHITALLDHGGMDDQAEEMFGQVSSMETVIDCVVECLRVRVGVTIARIERIPALARVLAVMDPPAVAWAKSYIAAPDSSIIEAIAKGKVSPLSFNLSSTRHMVIRMHSLLFADPRQQRDAAWVGRREKCDALLSVCNNLAQLQPK